MIYADYNFYLTEYLGSAISETNFPRLALKASNYIDYITLGRAEPFAAAKAVKIATCALAEQYATIEAAKLLADSAITSAVSAASDGGEVVSQTVGSWSRSYRSGGESAVTALSTVRDEEARLKDIAHQYLAGTGLLYRGCGCTI